MRTELQRKQNLVRKRIFDLNNNYTTKSPEFKKVQRQLEKYKKIQRELRFNPDLEVPGYEKGKHGCKPVQATCKKTGEVLEFTSIKHAAEITGFRSQKISDALRKVCKCKEYDWKYLPKKNLIKL